jgi:hypothetical protein
MLKALALFFILAFAAPGESAPIGQGRTQADNLARVIALLEKSGYSYRKVGDGVWEVPATGSNIRSFPIRLALAGDLVLFLVKLKDRADLNLRAPLLLKLLELNDRFDSVKFALSNEMLYVRTEIHTRLLDDRELKYIIEQIANVVDEAYPELRSLI